jgi:hypothetical protein
MPEALMDLNRAGFRSCPHRHPPRASVGGCELKLTL